MSNQTPVSKPIIFNFHGYPWPIHRLAYHRPFLVSRDHQDLGIEKNARWDEID